MSDNSKKTVVVGMSGGVDSSVTALLLKNQGYNVIGMFMKNWEEKDENGVCKASLEFEDVVRVCEQIKIPYYSVNFVKEYWDNVFTEFLNEFKLGNTPNPDILCNREIKFKVLLEKAYAYGADYLATGHYCQTNGQQLIKGVDLNKDQSYFLYTLKDKILQKVMFPIGGMQKSEVRKIAKEFGLATSEKKDSTGICFIGERNFKQFLSQYLDVLPGDFKTLSGKTVGRHDGACYYTIGQRKGMGIGGAGDAWFVVGKDMVKNVVYVEQGGIHPSLYSDELIAGDLSFVSNDLNVKFPYHCTSKIRYRQEDQACTITKIEDGKCFVQFKIPQRAVTKRQSIVFYDGNICLGGGLIETPGLNYYERNLTLPKDVSL